MIRLLTFVACVGLALPGIAQPRAVESIPVDRREPIVLRIVNGKTGQPLIHLHLVMVAGFNERDIDHRFWREEAFTNARGEARLPKALVNLPLLQVSAMRAKLCRASSQGPLYSIDRIRIDGLSSPNRCGAIQLPEAPGVLTIFAKQSGGGDADSAVSPVSLEASGHADSQTGEPPAKTPNSLSYPAESELRSLSEHSPARALGTGADGTAEPDDSYQQMCLPQR
jgi:hypothetical protein